MSKKTITRILAALLVLCLALGLIAPAVYATEAETTEAAAPAETTEEIAVVSDDAEEIAPQAEEPVTKDYASFLSNLKILEGYANSYYATDDTNDAGKLVVNFIRTGVERYTEGLWSTLAGEEITAFVDYVAAQDAANGTSVMALRNLYGFKLPNGDVVDFGHMFGCMNISYIAPATDSGVYTADLSGWAGDLCDLMLFSSKDYRAGTITGTIDEMAAVIKDSYFGVDAEDAFGMDDFYGDMDGYYLIREYKANSTTFSKLMEGRFTANMTSKDRAEYFLKNRFDALLTKEDVRNAVYAEFSANVALDVLKADYGVADLDELGQACCYAFADYLYGLAGDTLTGESSGEGDGEGEGEGEDDKVMDNDFYSVISSKSTTLAPGIVQTNKFAITADNKQIAYYIAEVDVAREDVSVHANYANNDPSLGWGMARVADQMAAAQDRHSDPNSELYVENYKTIVGVNADFYNMSTGKPSGALVMEGVQYNPVGSENFFAILDDGSAVIGAPGDWSKYEGRVQEAVGGSIYLVKDGKSVVTTTNNYYLDRASRTCVGIKADGKVVLMVLDGRQEPFSCGGSAAEIAQIMVDAGCVVAINLDGGGSTTFAAKPEGSDTVQIVSSPSDGFARSVSSSLLVVSTAKASNEFDHTLITTDADYLTVGTALNLSVVGVSSSGNAAEIPAGTTLTVSDSAVGTISNGVFTAKAEGEVEVQSVLNGQVVGSKKLYVVTPDAMIFEKDSLNVIYGVPCELPLQASYNGNPVAISGNDVTFKLSVTNAGTINGLAFTGNEKSGARNITATATLKANTAVKATLQIVLYKEGETSFDFGEIDGGDRHLAWKRPISNTTTIDNYTYHITDPNEDMVIDYTFALDMEAVEIPDELADIVYMLPGADVTSSAWGFLLQLAERVSVLTKVTVTAQFDQDLDVDISKMKIINEYFYLRKAEIDENNVLTAEFGWHDQTAAIDPKTANPLCILTGITAVPKDGAAWDANDQIKFINVGEVEYDIYLRANALYAFALEEKNQLKYRLIPFENPKVIVGGVPERGASFANVYAEFNDSFILDKTNRTGWFDYDNFLYYYQDNVPLTGIQKLPGYEDPNKEYFYEFAEDGSCIGTVTGLMEYEGNLYYAIRGEIQKGWKTLPTADGQKTYYFHTSTGAAVDGKQTIGGYNYIFTDKVLTRGHLETNANGTHYMWAGQWITQAWVTIDGRTAYAAQNGYFFTGLRYTYSPEGVWTYYAFGEDGYWMDDFTGLYDYTGNTYMIKNGLVAVNEPGVVHVGNYYYYINSAGTVVKNRTDFVIGKDSDRDYTNGLLAPGKYNLDEQGRITNPFGEEIEIPDEEFDIAFANMTLGNSLAMNFAFPQEPIEDRTGCYAQITKVFADGRENKVITIPAEKWGTTRINGVAHYSLKYDGVAAKEMSDSIFVCIYNANGTPLSTVWEDSVRSYVMRTLNNPNTSLESQIMVIDLLNYGATAQTYFGYNTGDLANKLLSPAHMELATDRPDAADNRVAGKNYKGTQLVLESQILMRYGFQNITPDMYAVISFTNHVGRDIEVIVEGEKFVKVGKNIYGVTIDSIVVADAKNLVTVTVYDSNDREVAYAVDSVEGYIARMREDAPDELFEKILCFATSAYNYFH